MSTSYNYVPSAPDPGNGNVVSTETWVQTDAHGNIVRLHVRSTLPDGTLLQEVVESNNQESLALGPAYHTVMSPIGNGCIPGPAIRQQPRRLYPLFVDRATLPQLGYRAIPGLPVQPLTDSGTGVPGVAPASVYGIDNSVATWAAPGPSRFGMTTAYQLEVQSDGKIDAVRAVTQDSQRRVVSENRQLYGPLAIYPVSSVPASYFVMSAQGQEACRG